MSLLRALIVPAGLILVATPLAPQSPAAGSVAPRQAEDAGIEIPFEMSPRGHIMVDMSVDGGEPVPFALDTGAGITVVNRSRLEALGLEERAEREDIQRAHSMASLGWTGVGALSMGDAVFEGQDVGVLDLTDVEAGQLDMYGILGFDILGDYDVSLDFTDRTVTLYPRAADLANCGVCVGDVYTDFDLAMGTHIQFEVSISGRTIQAILDTGSGRTGMNRLAAAAIGVELPETMPGGHAPGLRVGEIGMGSGALARETPVGVIDLPAFDALGVGDGPAILIGTATLAGHRVGISYGLSRIFVE
jgi:predicted aspartyl protease